jgi:hypothetical protein
MNLSPVVFRYGDIIPHPEDFEKSYSRFRCFLMAEGYFSRGVVPKGTPWNQGRAAAGNGLRMFPVSRLRIPKISDFCEKRNENSQTRYAQTV